ncbi:hypothetical protein GCM10011579_054660 [Streptomyces albiflavescens]|uniref:Uncharacterized protein n=1 Tax=Streptomyces albiflavescens TaxID=1623582 RepID=A0A917Y721_9ACTN|nr:hypothetical protein [Streptomyces albiflavescens]GGN74997.1 hypothetical protein GCM10011579_054660 [Streptomyces albiflavescens]
MSERRDTHDRHEPYEWHEPMDRQEPHEDEREQQAGNGTVNHGPDGHRPDGPGPDGLGSDELALRRLLHQAVQEIEPTDGTLDHLRRAVPARRARKRQAVIGMAAAALFIGTAIPAFVHVSNSSGSNADPSIAANTSQAQGGAGEGKDPDGGDGKAAGGSGGTSIDKGKGGKTGTPDKGKDAGGGGATTGGADPTPSAVTATACTAEQLGGAGAVGTPDSAGAVYGSFTVSNVSTAACTVSSAGTVSATAQNAADPAKVLVATHVSGDAATGLPDPSTEVTSMVLQPGGSYVVKFAWVPSETCPTTSEPSPDPSPTEGATDTGGTSTETGGTSAQLVTEDGVADGSVLVSNTAETGTATSSATVSNACAGTVYHTGILAAS